MVRINLIGAIIYLKTYCQRMNPQNGTLRYVRLTCPQDIEGYMTRQQQPMPSSPRITVDSQNQQILCIVVEKLAQSFLHTDWSLFSQQALFQYLETAIIANMGLRKKYGCFRINQTLIRLNATNSVRVWINQDPVLNYPQFPLPFERGSEAFMVLDILKLFKPIISELELITRPQTLQGFLSQVRALKNPSLSFNKSSKVQSGKTHTRKTIKSFYQMPILKPTSSVSGQGIMNSSVDGIHQKNLVNNLGKVNSPNNYSFTHKKQQTFFESPKTSFSKRHNLLALQLKKRLVNFTFSSPMSMKSSMMQQEIHSYIQMNPVLERSAHPKTQTYKTPQSESLIAQQNQEDLHQKERLFGPPKFPHSTESTFVTLKETKSFSDMHFDHFDTFDNPAIEEEQQSEYNLRTSSNGSKKEKSRKASCNGISSGGKSKKSKGKMGESGNIEDEFENLFFGDGEKEDSREQEQFNRREMEFEQILFS